MGCCDAAGQTWKANLPKTWALYRISSAMLSATRANRSPSRCSRNPATIMPSWLAQPPLPAKVAIYLRLIRV